jgi:hypothetical protein
VYWSAAEVALVPPGEATRMSTVPVPAGEVAVICVAEFIVNEVAAVPPNVTAVALVKPVPVRVTEVPPAAGPDVGEMPVTAGAGRKVNWSADEVALVPPPVVTVMSTVPVPAGDVAVICVAESTVKPVAAVPPNVTASAPVRLVPVMVTEVPPASGPADGAIPVTNGNPIYVNSSAADAGLVPPEVVTRMSTVLVPAGAVAVICVAESIVNEVAGVPANVTAVAPVKLVPVIVTVVPPSAGPDVGEMPVTAGAGR